MAGQGGFAGKTHIMFVINRTQINETMNMYVYIYICTYVYIYIYIYTPTIYYNVT